MFAGSGLFLSVVHFLVNEISSSDFKTELDASIFVLFPSKRTQLFVVPIEYALNDLNLLICI